MIKVFREFLTEHDALDEYCKNLEDTPFDLLTRLNPRDLVDVFSWTGCKHKVDPHWGDLDNIWRDNCPKSEDTFNLSTPGNRQVFIKKLRKSKASVFKAIRQLHLQEMR